jgi:hypothetical protein
MLLSFSVEEREIAAHYYIIGTPLIIQRFLRLITKLQRAIARDLRLPNKRHGESAVSMAIRLWIRAQGATNTLSCSHKGERHGYGRDLASPTAYHQEEEPTLYSQESDRMFILHIKKFRLNQPAPALGRKILVPRAADARAQKRCVLKAIRIISGSRRTSLVVVARE